jgi:ADP-ribosyl-[dinitrogen reductase] hydrolase
MSETIDAKMPAVTTPSTADHCRGVLLGLAAGDKNGGPIRMAVHLAESLRDCRRFDPADILQRYVDWWKAGAFDTGPVSDRALEFISMGMPVPEATAQVHRKFGGKTAGCNPAHRSAPLSMLAAIADEDLTACAMAEARMTHHDPLAGEVAAAVNRLFRMLIRGVVWDDALRPFAGFTGQADPSNKGGYAPDALRAALHFVGTSDDFAEALERSLAFAGPANYCSVLVGAIAGARWGASTIPQAALAHVDILNEVRAAAEALALCWESTSD